MQYLLLLFMLPTAEPPPQTITAEIPPAIRAWFDNPDGSCVQCSIGMNGIHNNNLNAAMLLFNTAYGKAQRGGSTPSRVASYCDERGIKAWNITGSETVDWTEWAVKTNRGAAIGFSTRHFQTLYGKDYPNNLWLICDNNSTHRIDQYTYDEFLRKHLQSGRWIVILQGPSPPPVPQYVKWW